MSRHGPRGPVAARSLPEYRILRGAISRCENRNCPAYSRYGGAGVKIAPIWRRNFWQFLADVGRRPSPRHTLDRIDPSGDYAPGNVRWATRAEQNNNKRSTRWVIYRGERMSVCDAARLAGSTIHPGCVWSRIRRGWAVDAALETSAWPTAELPSGGKDLRGQTFGLLTVTQEEPEHRSGALWWRCNCACGGQTVAGGSQLRNGHVRSCGCRKYAGIGRKLALPTRAERMA